MLLDITGESKAVLIVVVAKIDVLKVLNTPNHLAMHTTPWNALVLSIFLMQK